MVFFLPPWEEIYQSDNERYESYDQAVTIGNTLTDFYQSQNYEVFTVPKLPVDQRLLHLLTAAGLD
jgi:predicted ATPase